MNIQIVLLFQLFGTVYSCARIYEVCCSSIQKTDNVNPRFDSPDILYTEPQLNIDSSCGSAQIDCTLPGLDSEVYYLIYTDGNGNVLKAKGSLSPFFNTSTADLSCSTGYQNKDVYLSCEQGCTFDVCGHYKDCSCPAMQDYFEIQGKPQGHSTKTTVTYGPDCQSVQLECFDSQNLMSDFLEILVFNTTTGGGYFKPLSSPVVDHRMNVTVPDYLCQDSSWQADGVKVGAFITSCAIY